eukprot:7478523-Karenia_brevis.AAC.1
MSDWMRNYKEFATTLCHSWDIPFQWHETDQGDRQKIIQSIRLPADIDLPPHPDIHPTEHDWEAGHTRLWIQTDNQLVADVFAGRSVLDAEYWRPLCLRISRALLSLCEEGFLPKTNDSDMVVWDFRKWNAVADHAANA